MQRLTAPPPAAPPRGTVVKPSLKLPAKRLDEDLLSIVRRRKHDVGVFPGVPFN
jgi:hypothetical protein